MSYIGREPTVGNFQVCDAISVVNGQAAYTMQVSSVNVSPETENHMLVSLNGILQRPGSSFTVSGSTITFASNLATGDVINFIHILGSVLDLGVPSDSTVSLAKLTATGTKDATTFLRGDNTFAAAGGGKIGQVIQTVITSTVSHNNASFTDVTGMSVSITPSATSSKILVMLDSRFGITTNYTAHGRLVRGSTVIYVGDSAGSRNQAFYGDKSAENRGAFNFVATFLDSPSSTSSVTYKLQTASQSSSAYIDLNRTINDSNNNYDGRFASSITVMEVLA